MFKKIFFHSLHSFSSWFQPPIKNIQEWVRETAPLRKRQKLNDARAVLTACWCVTGLRAVISKGFLLVHHCVVLFYTVSEIRWLTGQNWVFFLPSLIRCPRSLFSLWTLVTMLTMMKLVTGLSSSEDRMIVAWVMLTQCQRVTDSQTDGRTMAVMQGQYAISPGNGSCSPISSTQTYRTSAEVSRSPSSLDWSQVPDQNSHHWSSQGLERMPHFNGLEIMIKIIPGGKGTKGDNIFFTGYTHSSSILPNEWHW